MLIILSAPSGGGKSTILKALLDSDASLYYSISATTRPRRSTEVHGRDYYFYTEQEFEQLVEQGAFYEWARVHGNLYGTLKSEVNAKMNAGRDVLLDIDVQGSMRMKQQMPDCTTIFILPPSMATLEKRLRERQSEDEETLQRRLANARNEVRMADRYDYILVNQDLDKTIANMRTIVNAQRFRSSRITLKDGMGSVLLSSSREA